MVFLAVSYLTYLETTGARCSGACAEFVAVKAGIEKARSRGRVRIKPHVRVGCAAMIAQMRLNAGGEAKRIRARRVWDDEGVEDCAGCNGGVCGGNWRRAVVDSPQEYGGRECAGCAAGPS